MQVPATPKSCESLTAFLQSLDSTKEGSEVRGGGGGRDINPISQPKVQFDLNHISIFSAECTIGMVWGAAIC